MSSLPSVQTVITGVVVAIVAAIAIKQLKNVSALRNLLP